MTNIQVKVSPTTSTNKGFAKTLIKCKDLNIESEIFIDFKLLKSKCGNNSPIALDLLFIACCVYGVDKLIPRSTGSNNWTRTLRLDIPVSNPKVFTLISEKINKCLSFLTGDEWSIEYNQLTTDLDRCETLKYQLPVSGAAVCLFSGGLDSLVGALDWLEANPSENLVLLGHHDISVGGPAKDQSELNKVLTNYKNYKNRISNVFIGIGQRPSGREATYRSRSFLFLALGLYVAQSLGNNVPILIAENGTIALNVPISPSRRGSCSTRTVHPHFILTLSAIINKLGFQNKILNPLEYKTKGEALKECKNQQLIKEIIRLDLTSSCARGGRHRIFAHRKDTKNCGRCMPCIYRRAAIHKIKLDDLHQYGLDICTESEVDIRRNAEIPKDLRTCLSFIKKNYNTQQISSMLISNGPLEINSISKYSKMINRTFDEIRQLLKDKATPFIKSNAGIK